MSGLKLLDFNQQRVDGHLPVIHICRILSNLQDWVDDYHGVVVYLLYISTSPCIGSKYIYICIYIYMAMFPQTWFELQTSSQSTQIGSSSRSTTSWALSCRRTQEKGICTTLCFSFQGIKQKVIASTGSTSSSKSWHYNPMGPMSTA